MLELFHIEIKCDELKPNEPSTNNINIMHQITSRFLDAPKTIISKMLTKIFTKMACKEA